MGDFEYIISIIKDIEDLKDRVRALEEKAQGGAKK